MITQEMADQLKEYQKFIEKQQHLVHLDKICIGLSQNSYDNLELALAGEELYELERKYDKIESFLLSERIV